MTYCLGIKVKEGIVGLADTRITSGNQTLTAKKVIFKQKEGDHAIFLMTSGLRTLRDKALTYFNEMIEEQERDFTKMYKLVNAFGAQIRRVGLEDRHSLKESGYDFNINALIAGQLKGDDEHKLFMIFPEGNWVEVGEANPYFIIGNAGHGKPILDRVLRYDSSLEFALKVAFLSFNSTQVSSNDVDYPIDIMLYLKDSFIMLNERYDRKAMNEYSEWWQKRLSQAINEFPNDWARDALLKHQQYHQQQ